MAIFTIHSVVIWFSTGTLGIFATLVYLFTMRVRRIRYTDVYVYDILSMAVFTILFGNYYPLHGEFELICIGKFARRT